MLKTLFAGIGNYDIEKPDNNTTVYRYHNNRICIVDEIKKTFRLDSCGWGGYRSTTRALNDLEKHYTRLGYALESRA